MSVQHKKNFTKLDNHGHILVKKGLGAVARRFVKTRKVRLRDGKVFFLFIRILFFSKNATYFVIEPIREIKNNQAHTLKYNSNSFLQMQCRLLPNLIKILRKQTTAAKKYLKMARFLKFEHSSLPITIIKENRNDWTCNFKWLSCSFSQF